MLGQEKESERILKLRKNLMGQHASKNTKVGWRLKWDGSFFYGFQTFQNFLVVVNIYSMPWMVQVLDAE